MYRIAIVEDEEIHYDVLNGHIANFSNESNKVFDVTWYKSPLVFLDSFKMQYDIIFLDIRMPGMDGMQLARAIRKTDPKVVIVFITSLAQYAIEGYSVNAMDYVLKPVSYEEFKLKITRILHKVATHEETTILCSRDKTKFKINIDNVYYLESNIHQVIVHTLDGEYYRYGSMSEMEKELKDRNFKKINSCFLVNMLYVSGVKKDECIMKNGDSLKISRSHVKEISSLFAK